jgi:hypothetical protein
MKWHINCKLVVVQPVKVSTTGMPSIKSVRDGSQRNSPNCTKRSIWTSAKAFWIAMVLHVTTSWKESSLEMKLWPTITNQRVNTRVWIGNIVIHPPRKVQNAFNRRKAYANSFWNIIKRWVKQWTLRTTVWWAKACNSKPMKRTTVRKRCVVARQCLSSHCYPHCWNPEETKLWGIGASPV